MDGIALAVAEDLHLDMPGPVDPPFGIDNATAEGALGFAFCGRDRTFQFAGVANDAHTPPAAAGSRLDDQRKTDLGRGALSKAVALLRRWRQGHAVLRRKLARLDLVAHERNDIRRRPDEAQSSVGNGTGEISILRQEAVSRMDGCCAHRRCRLDNLRRIQVCADRRFTANLDRLVGLAHRGAGSIQVVEDHGTANAHAPERADDPAGDFAAVGDQHLVE